MGGVGGVAGGAGLPGGMAMISLIIGLVVIGVVLYLINTILPMDGRIRTLINVIVILAVCIWLLRFAGLV